MAITWIASKSSHCKIGVDWQASVSESSVSLTPIVYRHDDQNTADSATFSEVLSGTGGGSWSGISFGSGSGDRKVDTFSKRTYTRGDSDIKITLTITTSSNFGTYYNGFITLGTSTFTFTYTIPKLEGYTITYNSQGGSKISAVTVKKGETFVVDSSCTRAGYTLSAWNTKAGGGGAEYTLGAEVTPTASMTLYAQWTAVVSNIPIAIASNKSVGIGCLAPAGTDEAGFLKIGHKIWTSGSRLLADVGGKYMTSGHIVTLSEPVSSQAHGIVLVWSAYSSSTVRDYNWHFDYIPKEWAASYAGSGVCCTMSTSDLAQFGTKYVYVDDNQIKGADNNSKTGTGTCGIKYTNNYWVLRYVYGV